MPVIHAGHADIPAIAGVMAAAFIHLPQSRWIVPDDWPRAVTFPAYTRMQVEDALNHGTVHAWVTAGRQIRGAALWTWAEGYGSHPDAEEYAERLVVATGQHVERYRLFEQVVGDHAPPDGAAHMHLWMLGVHPDHQGQGIGTALLRVMHDGLDAAGYTAYLEAADQRSRALYLRHGYIDAGPPYHLPESGPPFYPMLRRPEPRVDPASQP